MAEVFGNLKQVVNLISLDVVCYFVEHLLNISNWDKCEKHNKMYCADPDALALLRCTTRAMDSMFGSV